ncbi:sugar transferase [Agathobacter sp.]|uniref:Polyprenyl glycosylphosphotransferase n=2 Tax=Lachnospiraceae TaxID=186803 RepID=A0A2G3E4V2_9FIRM|nr:sugar transferase [Agathobacter sp.]PHU38190.1 polyprenyl glycosylphosphotransferase [Agathobacter ruminis]
MMYRKINSGWLKHWDFELFDIVCMEIALIIAYLYRKPQNLMQMYMRISLLLVLFAIAVDFFTKNYENIIQRTKWIELWAVIKHITIIHMVLLIYMYLSREIDAFSRTIFLLSWGISIFLCYGERVVWKKIVRYNLTKEKNQANMLLISDNERVAECVKSLRIKPYRGFKICAVALLHEQLPDGRIDANIPILYGRDVMLEYIRQNVVDEVFIDAYQSKQELSELTDIFLSTGITVHIGTGYLPKNMPNQLIEKIGAETAITTSLQVAQEWKLTVKRLVDIIGGLVGVIFTGILCLFVVPAIKIVDPGPVFFKQKRVGKGGRVFHIYKFRTMYVDAEARKAELMAQNEMKGLMFKMENDPRIIGSEKGPGKGLGNFLRKTSIDEFPQFVNILKGDMSLVGTRPPTLSEYEQYSLHHKVRLSMKPGLTGMWQVSGRSNITDFEEVIRLDEKYLQRWSLRLDVKILFKTVGVVLGKRGSK